MSKMKLLVNKIYSSMSMYKYADNLSYPFFFSFSFSFFEVNLHHSYKSPTDAEYNLSNYNSQKISIEKEATILWATARENTQYLQILTTDIYKYPTKSDKLQFCIEAQVHLISLSPSSTPKMS